MFNIHCLWNPSESRSDCIYSLSLLQIYLSVNKLLLNFEQLHWQKVNLVAITVVTLNWPISISAYLLESRLCKEKFVIHFYSLLPTKLVNFSEKRTVIDASASRKSNVGCCFKKISYAKSMSDELVRIRNFGMQDARGTPICQGSSLSLNNLTDSYRHSGLNIKFTK